jgi:hypothetical protein
VTLHFAGQQILKTVHAEDGVRLSQKNSREQGISRWHHRQRRRSANSRTRKTQDIEMTAPVMDFIVKDGRLLKSAETSGPPRIVITQPGSESERRWLRPQSSRRASTKRTASGALHGEPDAKIVSGMHRFQ